MDLRVKNKTRQNGGLFKPMCTKDLAYENQNVVFTCSYFIQTVTLILTYVD